MSALQETYADTWAPINIRPLQPHIGAEITGVDLSLPITDAQRIAIKEALLKYKVVFFRD